MTGMISVLMRAIINLVKKQTPILSKFINDITVNQNEALTTLMNHEHHYILINMLVEQLEFMILMGGSQKHAQE